jgi:hypothetical protein
MKRLLLFLAIAYSAAGLRARSLFPPRAHAKGGGPKPWPVDYEPYLVVNSEVYHQYPTEIAVRFRNTPPFNANITYDWGD